jgi:hypothetical protein
MTRPGWAAWSCRPPVDRIRLVFGCLVDRRRLSAPAALSCISRFPGRLRERMRVDSNPDRVGRLAGAADALTLLQRGGEGAAARQGRAD